MESETGGETDGSEPSTSAAVCTALSSFLQVVLPHMLNVQQPTLAEALKDADKSLRAFAEDARVTTLVVSVPNSTSDPAATEPAVRVSCDLCRGENVLRVACVKHSAGPLDTATPLPQQLHVLSLSAGSPLDALHACLRGVFGPLLRAAELPTPTATALLEKCDDLEKFLRRWQGALGIAEAELAVPAAVTEAMRDGTPAADAVARLEREGALGDVLAELGRAVPAHLEDLSRLCALPAERAADLAEGSAEQLVAFWGRYEEALGGTVARLDRAEVVACVAAMTGGRRFQLLEGLRERGATVAQRLRQAALFNRELLRDLPLRRLLSCLGSVPRLGEAPEALAAISSRLTSQVPRGTPCDRHVTAT